MDMDNLYDEFVKRDKFKNNRNSTSSVRSSFEVYDVNDEVFKENSEPSDDISNKLHKSRSGEFRTLVQVQKCVWAPRTNGR